MQQPKNPGSAASRMKAEKDKLLRLWMERVRKEVPAARDLDEITLKNNIPQILEILADTISVPGSHLKDQLEPCAEIVRSHGVERAGIPDYTLDQVILEYRLLRCIILDVVEAEEPLSLSERNNLLESIDRALIEATTEFTQRLGFEKSRYYEESKAEHARLKKELKSSRSRMKVAESQLTTEREATRAAEGGAEELRIERELREKFVSSLSHDLRTPLTAARASAELLFKKAETDLSRKLSSHIVDDVDRADRMIRDLLDANRLKAGQRLPLRIDLCDLSSVIRETLEKLATVHGDRFFFSSHEKVEGYWDCAAVQRIIENLADNAIKYGATDLPVTVTLTPEAEQIEITVHNEGNPISKEDQASLFQQFRRSATAQRGGKIGWGIGLTLVRGVAEAHGGSVSVESIPGTGTTFRVQLPRDARAHRAA